MTLVESVIVFSWFATLAGGLVFLWLFGMPWRAIDHTMAWHLFSIAAVAVMEMTALFVTGWSLVPAMVAYLLGACVMWWRTAILIGARRRARQERRELEAQND